MARHPFVKPGFRLTKRSTDCFWFLSTEKKLNGPHSDLFYLISWTPPMSLWMSESIKCDDYSIVKELKCPRCRVTHKLAIAAAIPSITRIASENHRVNVSSIY